MSTPKSKYDQAFQKALGMLNEEQLKAVKKTEDPVMVLAGPGTGKTQLLGVRVGYILQNTDAKAHNILCLTFTDAGAVAMRSRLLSFIGPEAYNAHIYTYHAFCNSVIQDNLEFFGGYRELQLVSDIEMVEIIHQIIDEIPNDSILKRLKGQIYFDRRNLVGLFSTLKRENWSYEMVAEFVDKHETEMRDSEDMKYKRKSGENMKGDFNEGKFRKEMDKYWKIKEAASFLEKYNQLLKKRERFDYQDMILFVLDAFKNHEDLKLDYQERYHYILVDEYQDTNGSQNDLVFALADYWDNPNLFVVGDDDQAIYRFQGANMNSLNDFIGKFTPDRYMLRNNYRSYQGILDAAYNLINKNDQRIANQVQAAEDEEDMYKLQESRIDNNGKGSDPIVLKYGNQVQEQAGLVDKIMSLHEQGVAYKDMAVIYRSHKSAGDLVRYFTYKDIPLQIKKRVNVLDLMEIKKVHNIMTYLHLELEKQDQGENLLFEIMHYDYFGLKPRDIGYLAAHCSNYTDVTEDDRKWRKAISDPVILEGLVSDPDQMIAFSEMLEGWIGDISNLTLQRLFEKVITQSGLINNILIDEDKAWRLQVLNKYFDLIKNESAKNPDYTLADLINNVRTMIDTDISIPLVKVIYNEDGINFLTAHGSKGLEFEYVFIINATKKEWEQKNATRGFRFPPGLVPISETSDVDDDRRLFYVALTRAKNFAYVSFANYNSESKELEATRFVSEMGETIPVQDGKVSEERLIDYMSGLMQFEEGKPVLIDKNLVDKLLNNFALSATSLNKFIRCRLSFYFENLLRVPMARSYSMGYGNAIHYALEMFFTEMENNADRAIPTEGKMFDYFKKGMKIYRSHFTDKEYNNLLLHGEKTVHAYFEEYKHSWSTASKFILEKSIKNVSVGEIPIKGKLDKIEIYDQHIEVIDYKTGKYQSKKLNGKTEDNPGGDYWRQLVFYKLLIDHDPTLEWKMDHGTMDFVEKAKDKKKFDKIRMPISDEDQKIVKQQLKETWDAIHKYEFEQFCEDEECRWCNFVKSTAPIVPVELDESYNDDDTL